MKIERFFSKLLLVAVLCTFCACSSDDDEDLNTGGSGQGISLNIGGTKHQSQQCVLGFRGQRRQHHLLRVAIHVVRYVRIPGRWRLFIIPVKLFSRLFIFRCPGSPSELPVGTFSEDDYDLSGALDMTLDNEEGRYYVEEGSASSDLVITRDGNNYTISIPSLEIVYSDPKEVGSGRWNSTTVNWNYTGTVKKAPQY